jgi:hypothetical protein
MEDKNMAVVKILKQGETDKESNDIWRFALHSDYPAQKVALFGQTTLKILSGNTFGTKAVVHSLGYAPIVFAMFQNYSNRYVKVNGQKNSYRPVDDEAQIYSVKTDSSQILFNADPLPSTAPAGSDIDINVYYLILYEEI